MDPFLQGVRYTTKVRVLTGFAARVRRGLYGRGKRVLTGTVVGALATVGQEVALACGEDPIKVTGSKKLLPWLSQIYNGWPKEDPPTATQLPVEADIPELLAEKGHMSSTTELERAIRDLSLIAFCYLLHIGEYTVKGKWNKTKQMVQFKYEDITFFKKNSSGQLRCLPRNAPAHLISTADSTMMKLDNQKNGWKGVCIYQEANGNNYLCPVMALGWRFLYLGYREDFSLLVLGEGCKSRCHGGTHKSSIKICRNRTSIPYKQGNPNNKDQHALSAQQRCQCPSIGGILADPENETQARGHVQRVY